MSQNSFFPLILNLKGKKCVVVGGGEVACRKIKRLLECGAEVVVISPRLTAKLKEMKEKGQITHLPREYRRGDLKDSFLVVGATRKASVNREVAKEAREVRALVNVVDSPLLCDFFVPSFLRKGKLIISISTQGTSPALAKRIKTELEKAYGEEYTQFLDWMGEVREKIIRRVRNKNKRKEILSCLVESEVLPLLKKGQREKARDCFLRLIQEVTGKFS